MFIHSQFILLQLTAKMCYHYQLQQEYLINKAVLLNQHKQIIQV